MYQWFKDGQKLVMATSDSPQLIVAEVSPLDAGTYHCQVCVGVCVSNSDVRMAGACADTPVPAGVSGVQLCVRACVRARQECCNHHCIHMLLGVCSCVNPLCLYGFSCR